MYFYLGRQERIELYRDGSKITDLAFDQYYSYDSPVLHRFVRVNINMLGHFRHKICPLLLPKNDGNEPASIEDFNNRKVYKINKKATEPRAYQEKIRVNTPVVFWSLS